ncbi:hypothetical protein PCASD_13558 [Puccinia coronata f. sp. avenae]|uniref:Uncharacterized protein n=1 Tax=Puccinia coronata f. sp. avenae TaxID=200324 RepID=A0A2N5TDX4_9BASI|nr:hypothetical protein PCASD_13558 [Puccinia coronata f. sp. avenae]
MSHRQGVYLPWVTGGSSVLMSNTNSCDIIGFATFTEVDEPESIKATNVSTGTGISIMYLSSHPRPALRNRRGKL